MTHHTTAPWGLATLLLVAFLLPTPAPAAPPAKKAHAPSPKPTLQARWAAFEGAHGRVTRWAEGARDPMGGGGA